MKKKICNTCKASLSTSKFHKARYLNWDGYRGRCKECTADFMRRKREIKPKEIIKTDEHARSAFPGAGVSV